MGLQDCWGIILDAMDGNEQNLDAGTSCQWHEIDDCTIME
jgi:hypothetical protein